MEGPVKRWKVETTGELTTPELNGFLTSLTIMGLDKALKVSTREVKPLKLEEPPLVTVPEALKGRLGGMTYSEYETALEEAGYHRGFINWSWNRFQYFATAREKGSYRPVTDRSIVKEWQISSREARASDHSLGLDPLAEAIEKQTFTKGSFGVGPKIVGVWTELVKARIADLERQTEK